MTAPSTAAVVTALVAAAAVAYRPTWSVLRYVVTIAHEGGHAAVAALSGRRLTGVRLHSDTSGVTFSTGQPTGPGVVATLLAGYVAPSALGLLGASALARGHDRAVLVASIVLLVLLLVLIRNLFGVLSVVVTGGVLVALVGWAPLTWQSPAAHLLVWFLLWSGPRPVLELQRLRRLGRGRTSDADQLGRLTHVPGLFWVGLFVLLTVSALAWGGWSMLSASGTGAVVPLRG